MDHPREVSGPRIQGPTGITALHVRWYHQPLGTTRVNSTAAQMGWTLFSADVSQAFLRGLTFDEAAKDDAEVVRDVQFTIPPGSLSILQQLPGFKDFHPLTEVLQMLRCGFGLMHPVLGTRCLNECSRISVSKPINRTNSCTRGKLRIAVLPARLISSLVDPPNLSALCSSSRLTSTT